MNIERITPEEWAKVAEDAHLSCFEEIRPNWVNTIDYAVLVHDEKQPMAYATIIELESMVAHMQHGGAFPGTKGTFKSFKSYKMIIDYLSERYNGLTTNIENTNTPMLKFALEVGFIPVGIDCHTFGVYEGTYLHMYKENSRNTSSGAF